MQLIRESVSRLPFFLGDCGLWRSFPAACFRGPIRFCRLRGCVAPAPFTRQILLRQDFEFRAPDGGHGAAQTSGIRWREVGVGAIKIAEFRYGGFHKDRLSGFQVTSLWGTAIRLFSLLVPFSTFLTISAQDRPRNSPAIIFALIASLPGT